MSQLDVSIFYSHLLILLISLYIFSHFAVIILSTYYYNGKIRFIKNYHITRSTENKGNVSILLKIFD
uniref:ATP synthase F0 subunit 8 n=1 Tax=Eutima sp. BMK-2020 TaxID=2790655 RepID=A0A7S9DFK9_9CNID|nr:ATP synthase F0 subunit 8 [Eutima sp. BMK-2020]